MRLLFLAPYADVFRVVSFVTRDLYPKQINIKTNEV